MSEKKNNGKFNISTATSNGADSSHSSAHTDTNNKHTRIHGNSFLSALKGLKSLQTEEKTVKNGNVETNTVTIKGELGVDDGFEKPSESTIAAYNREIEEEKTEEAAAEEVNVEESPAVESVEETTYEPAENTEEKTLEQKVKLPEDDNRVPVFFQGENSLEVDFVEPTIKESKKTKKEKIKEGEEELSDIAILVNEALRDEKAAESFQRKQEAQRAAKEEQERLLQEELERQAREEEDVEPEEEETTKSDRIPPKTPEFKKPEPVQEDLFDYELKNKLLETVIKNTVLEDEDLDQLSKMLGNSSSLHTMRMSRRETGFFDMAWVKALEDAIPSIDEIVKNPKITTKTTTEIVPVELAKKIGSESVKHLASHTQYVKEVDEKGNVVPSKILSLGSDDEYVTYENRFVATVIRRLVLFIEKRYDYIVKYSKLKDYDILYIKNHTTVNGLDVDVQSKVVVSRPSKIGSQEEEDINGEVLMSKINLMRRYGKFFYSSDFMKRFKNEKNVRSPIMQTNIIKKNPKYHKVYNLYRFMEMYRALGVEFTIQEDYFSPDQEDIETINNLTVANFLAAKARPSGKEALSNTELKHPEIMTNIDDDIFTFFPVGEYPEFIRVDDEYLRWKERNTKDLEENPTKQVKAFRGADYLRKEKMEKERARREALKERRAAAREAFLKQQEEIIKAKEAERSKQEKLAEQRAEEAAIAQLEAARLAVQEAAKNEDEDMLLAIVTPIQITITGDNEIVAKTTFTRLQAQVEYYITDPNIVWSSCDETIATVDQTGFVSGLREGDVKIRATSVEDALCYRDYVVHVQPRPAITVEFRSIENLIVTKNTNIVPIVRNADDTSVIWHSSNEAVVSVRDGVVTAVSSGNAVLTAFSVEDNTKSYSINVHPLDGIELTAETHTLIAKRTTLDIIAKSNVSDDDMILFFSSDENIATVDQNGHVVPVSIMGGDVTIVAISSMDPSLSSKYSIHIEPKPIVSVTLVGDSKVILTRTNALIGTVINAVDSTAVWKSSNKSVATVDQDGVVTGHKLGTAKITCISLEEPDKSAQMTVEVKEAIVIDNPNVEVVANKTLQLSALSNVLDDDIIVWSSENESLATVDENGLVTGVSEGDLTIKAASRYDETLFSTFNLHVRPEITINLTGAERYLVSKSYQFNAIIENAYDPSHIFTSSDENIISIDENGLAVAKCVGNATITVTSIEDDTKSASLEVTILEGVVIEANGDFVIGNKTIAWNAISNVSEDDTIMWSSSNDDIALVDNGVIKGLKEGVVEITATSSLDDTLSASHTLNVGPEVVVEINNINSIIVGKEATLTASVFNTEDKEVAWSSNDESVATIDENGTIHTIVVGNVTFTATSHEDNEKNATINVNIIDGIELAAEETSLVSQRTTLTLSAKSNIDEDEEIIWSSSDENIATVSDGVVKGIEIEGGDVVIRAASSTDPDYYKEIEIHVDPKPATLVRLEGQDVFVVGRQAQLKVYVEEAEDDTVTFSSSDEAIATVNEKGVVLPIACGFATITATSVDPRSTPAKLYILVSEGTVIDESHETIATGVTKKFNAVSNISTDDYVIWSSSDNEIATVDQEGNVTGIKEGLVIIKASSAKDSSVTSEAEVKILPPINVDIDGDTKFVLGRVGRMSALIENAEDTSIKWSSSNEGVATIDEEGNLTPVSTGKTVITARSNEDIDKICTLEVDVFEGIVITDIDSEITVGSTTELSAVTNIENDTIRWSTSDDSMATVDENGILSTYKEGEITIYATSCSDSNIWASKTITIAPKPEIEVELYGTNKIFIEKPSKFSAYVSHATDETIIWSCSDETIASVNEEGLVTGISSGSATVTATSKEDENKSASFTFDVLKGLELEANEDEVIAKDDVVWNATSHVSPEDSIEWTSSDESIASVSEGIVTGVSEGVATITAVSSMDNTIYVSKSIKVLPREETVIEIGELESILVGESQTLEYSVLNAKDKSVIWSSSDNLVIRVDSDGTISGVSAGSADITVTSVEDETKFATTTIKCIDKVIIESVEESVRARESIQLNGISFVGDNDALIWTTSDVKVATVSPTGEVLGIGEGEVEITATSTLDSSASATKIINVLPGLPIVVEIIADTTTVNAGDTITLTTKILNTENYRVAWSSLDGSIAMVDDGVVTGVSSGEVEIIATSKEDTTRTASIMIEVKGGIEIQCEQNEIKAGRSATLTATSSFEGDKIVWSSSDRSVLRVADGVITGVAEGKARIKAVSTINPIVYKVVEIEVKPLVLTTRKTVVKNDKPMTLDDIMMNKKGRLVSKYKKETIIEEVVTDDGEVIETKKLGK